MKVRSFYSLCKLVLILANSTHFITEIGAACSKGKHILSSTPSLASIKGKSKTKSKENSCTTESRTLSVYRY